MRDLARNYPNRCPHCALLPRWCICAAEQRIQTPLLIDLITHRREAFRSSSSGNLITRVFSNARQHIWYADKPVSRDTVVRTPQEVWFLHPHGTPLASNADASNAQVILLDGSWSEVSNIARAVAGWGQLVQLPITGPSRFWLRDKQDNDRYSTAEALLFLLDALNLPTERDALRVQFELHVYAHLRARGKTALAEQFLADSVIQHALPTFLSDLQNNQQELSNAKRKAED
jgi:DTW domain-containing protein